MSPRSLRARLEATVVYLILTPSTLPGNRLEACRARLIPALRSGAVGAVQVRLTGLEAVEALAIARDVAAQVRAAGALFLVNDDVDLARRLDADGIHVGQDDTSPRHARALLGPQRLVGWSTHDAEELAAAHHEPVDYVGLGPCFPSTTKALTREPPGAALLDRAKLAEARLPVFPIGGIDASTAPALAAAGATRAAVGAGILEAEDPEAAARAIRDALRQGP